MNIHLSDVSAGIGLCSMVTLTFNVLLGMLLSTAYKTNAVWKKLPVRGQKINIHRLHNQTAYLALLLIGLHPLLLVLDPRTTFTFVDIFYPLHAPHQKIFVEMGTLSMLAVVTVVITTQKKIKKAITFRLWKNIHLVSYATAMLFIIHGLKMDPELKDRPTDWVDGEKLIGDACLVILLVATFMRIKYHNKKRKAYTFQNIQH